MKDQFDKHESSDPLSEPGSCFEPKPLWCNPSPSAPSDTHRPANDSQPITEYPPFDHSISEEIDRFNSQLIESGILKKIVSGTAQEVKSDSSDNFTSGGRISPHSDEDKIEFGADFCAAAEMVGKSPKELSDIVNGRNSAYVISLQEVSTEFGKMKLELPMEDYQEVLQHFLPQADSPRLASQKAQEWIERTISQAAAKGGLSKIDLDSRKTMGGNNKIKSSDGKTKQLNLNLLKSVIFELEASAINHDLGGVKRTTIARALIQHGMKQLAGLKHEIPSVG